MDWTDVGDIVGAFVAQRPGVVWATLLAGSFVEYVFPPFPGDTVVVAGAALVGAYGWSPWPVFAVTTAGAVAGAAVDFFFGRQIFRPLYERSAADTALHRRLEWVLDGFRRWGEAFLLLNRFFPGVRALFFVAAGMAGLRAGRSILFAALGAALWNALLLGAGWWAGRNVERLAALARGLGIAGWAFLGLVVAGALVLWWRRRGANDPSS